MSCPTKTAWVSHFLLIRFFDDLREIVVKSLRISVVAAAGHFFRKLGELYLRVDVVGKVDIIAEIVNAAESVYHTVTDGK